MQGPVQYTAQQVCDHCKRSGTLTKKPQKEYLFCSFCRQIFSLHPIDEADEHVDNESEGEINSNTGRVTTSTVTPYGVDDKIHIGMHSAQRYAPVTKTEELSHKRLHEDFIENKKKIDKYIKKVKQSGRLADLARQYYTELSVLQKQSIAEDIKNGKIKWKQLSYAVPFAIYVAWMQEENSGIWDQKQLQNIANICGVKENNFERYKKYCEDTFGPYFKKKKVPISKQAENIFVGEQKLQPDEILQLVELEKYIQESEIVDGERDVTVAAALSYWLVQRSTRPELKKMTLEEISNKFNIGRGAVQKFYQEKILKLQQPVYQTGSSGAAAPAAAAAAKVL